MGSFLALRPRAERGFERLYNRHVGDVYRYTLAVLRNPEDAEDVTQTTFMNAYRAYSRGERPEKPQNWLIAIAHNVCRQRFREESRRPSEVVFNEDIAEAVAPDEDGPSADDIRRALGHLAFNQRAALVMRELEGRSYAEIAELLEVSVSAVETLLFRARRAVREQLEGSLTCGEVERAISKQLDGTLARAQRGQLRAHLRECADCARVARSQRAQRAAWKALAGIPVPASLGSFFGGGGAAVGTATGAGFAFGGGLALKATAVVAGGALIVGGGYEAVKRRPGGDGKPRSALVREGKPPLVVDRSRTSELIPEVAASPPAVSKPVTKRSSERPTEPRPAREAKPPRAARPSQAVKPTPTHAPPNPPPPPDGSPTVVGLAAREQEVRDEEVAERPVGLAHGEEKARAAAGSDGRRAEHKRDVGLAKSERKARNEARRAERAGSRPAQPPSVATREPPQSDPRAAGNDRDAKEKGKAKRARLPGAAPTHPAPPSQHDGTGKGKGKGKGTEQSPAKPVPPPSPAEGKHDKSK